MAFTFAVLRVFCRNFMSVWTAITLMSVYKLDSNRWLDNLHIMEDAVTIKELGFKALNLANNEEAGSDTHKIVPI